jgi:predicted alpha/beta hydrolase
MPMTPPRIEAPLTASPTALDQAGADSSREVDITAADGLRLAATVFPAAPARRTDRAVLICSGTGIPRGFYAAYARFLASHGLDVVTFDYRGIGGSRPPSLKGFEATMRAWGELDVAAAVAWAHARFQPTKLLVVGHSAGGWLTALAPNSRAVDAMLSVASMSGYWGHMQSPEKYRLALIWYLGVPLVARIFGFLPGHLGTKEDLPKGVALEWARWCRRPEYFFADPSFDARARLADLTCAIRAYQFADDPWGTPMAMRAMLDGYGSTSIEYLEVTPAAVGATAIGHFGFFRQQIGAGLWPQTLQWLVTI